MSDPRQPTFAINPSKPKLRLPAGAWDTHCHIFGPKERFPFAPTSKIDPADAAKEQLFALHEMLGIERCVIVQSAVHGADNRVVEDALLAKGGAYLGIALLPITVADAELRRLDRLGFRGVRFNFMKHLQQAASIEEVIGLGSRLADIGWHLQIHMESTLIESMTPILKRSVVPVVIDHIGRSRCGTGIGAGAVSESAAPDRERWVLGEGQWMRPHHAYGSAVRRRTPFRAPAGRRVPGSCPVGHRLAPPAPRGADSR